MGVDFSKPVKIDKLREKAAEEFGGKKKKKEPEPLVPGFGVPQEETTVLAFGVRPPEPETSSSGRGNSRHSGDNRQDNDQVARAQGFADMMMRRYDRNGSGALEKDEWGELRGDPNEMDRNHDGKIDREELLARVSSYMNRSPEGERGRDSREGDNRDKKSQEQTSDRKSYRFLSPTERLPEGLPDWFHQFDANKDGQVTMAEYSSSWTDSKAREFSRFDLNDDGCVTPHECLQAIKTPEVEAPKSEGPAPSPTPSGPSPGGPGGPPPASQSKPEEKKDSGSAKPWWMS